MADRAKKHGADAPAKVAQIGPSAGSARALRKHLAIGSRWVRFGAWRVLLILKGLPGLILRVAGSGAVIVVLVLLGIELTRHQIEIQPIATPKSLEEAGYSPEVAALRLRDSIGRLTQDAVRGGGQTLNISMHGDMPDIVVPTVGLSVSTLGAYLQHFFGYSSRTTIGGELIVSEQRVSVLLRLNGDVIFRSREAVTADRLDEVWAKAAEAVMLEISPYRAALALYDANPEAAMQLADNIIGRYPSNDENVAWARLVRGSGLLESLQYSAAEKEFREVLQQAGHADSLYWNPFARPASYTEPALFYLGTTLLYRGHAAEAYTELKKAVRLEPNDPGAHYAIGMALQNLRKNAEANVEFTRSSTIYHSLLGKQHGSASARSRISFGWGLQRQNKEEEGLAQLRWAVELDPKSDYAHGRLCDGLRQAKHLDEALSECELAKLLAPQRVDNQTSLALLLMDLEDLEGAGLAGDEALRLAPKSAAVREVLGLVHEKAKHLDRAEAEYRNAARLAPDVARFHNELGAVLFDQAKFGDAAKEYQSAIDLTPDDAVLHANLAGALRGQNDFDGAVRECKIALGLDANQAYCQNEIGNHYFENKEFAAAVKAYRAAIALTPLDAVMHSNLAAALRQSRQPDAAIEEYRKAIALNSEDPDFYYNLAFALVDGADSAASEALRADQLADACRLLTEGVRLAPEDSDMRKELAPKLRKSAGCEAATVAGSKE